MSALIIATGVQAALNNYQEVRQLQRDTIRLQQEKDHAHSELEKLQQQNTQDQKKIEEQKKTEEDLKKQIQELSAAKAEKARLAALSASAQAYAQTPKARSVAVNGTCTDWIAAAGITDVANALELIGRESGCNPNAMNSSSGACGVAQELPCGKSGCALGDGACQVRWMNGYVTGRYGSWSAAVAWHNAHNWY